MFRKLQLWTSTAPRRLVLGTSSFPKIGVRGCGCTGISGACEFLEGDVCDGMFALVSFIGRCE